MINAIPTLYHGYRFRSRLEARWAVFFDVLGVEFEYEPEGLFLSDGTQYLPDFYLPTFRCYFEVKRKGIKWTVEGDEAVRKISDGCGRNWAGLITFGDPFDNDCTLFCQEFGVGDASLEVGFGFNSITRTPALVIEDWSVKERKFCLIEDEKVHSIPVIGKKGNNLNIVLKAGYMARQADFR